MRYGHWPWQTTTPSPRTCARCAVVGIDYLHITSQGVGSRDDMEEHVPDGDQGNAKLDIARTTGAVVKCIIVRCHKTKNLFSHVVPCKRPDEAFMKIQLLY